MPRHEEDDLQITVADFLGRALPPDAYFFAVPNGGKRVQKKNARGEWYSPEATRMKAMGVKAGVPDLIFCWRGHLFAIELKTAKGVPSKAQLDAIGLLQQASASVAICRSVEAVEAQLTKWGMPLRARIAA